MALFQRPKDLKSQQCTRSFPYGVGWLLYHQTSCLNFVQEQEMFTGLRDNGKCRLSFYAGQIRVRT